MVFAPFLLIYGCILVYSFCSSFVLIELEVISYAFLVLAASAARAGCAASQFHRQLHKYSAL